MTTYYNTNRFNKARFAAICAVVGVAVFLLTVAVLRAEAEARTVTAWVICQPGDWVNARTKGSRSSASIGMLETGHPVEVTGKTRNGYAECVHLSLEEDRGWIHAGYLVFDKPEWSGEEAVIVAKGRVAARKYADGPVRKWLVNGSRVQVFWVTDEWSVTSRGFIKTEYLEF